MSNSEQSHGLSINFEKLMQSVNQGDAIFIQSDAQADSSPTITALFDFFIKRGFRIHSTQDITLEQKPLIDQIYPESFNLTNTLLILKRVGLEYAVLLSKPTELTDEQLLRFYVAKMIESHADVWVFDDFGGFCDFEMAKKLAKVVYDLSKKHSRVLVFISQHYLADESDDFKDNQ